MFFLSINDRDFLTPALLFFSFEPFAVFLIPDHNFPLYVETLM